MKKLTVVVLVVMLVVPLGADRSSIVSSVITLETVVLARSTSTVSRIFSVAKEIGPWELALHAIGNSGGSTETTCYISELLLHGVGTAVPWAIVSSSIICGSFGTDTNSRHVVVRNAASTLDSVGIRGVDRSGKTMRIDSVCDDATSKSRVSFVKADSAINGSRACSTVRGTSTAEACANKEAGLAGPAGGSSSIDQAVFDYRGHKGSITTCNFINASSVLDEAELSGDLSIVIVELSVLGGGCHSGSYIN